MKKILFVMILVIGLGCLAGCQYQDASYYQYEENQDGTITIVGIKETYSKKLALPSSIDGKTVTAIGKYAFYNNDYIREIVIPDGVTVIGECAFADADKLKNVVLGKNCLIIGLQAFEGCDVLEEITLNNQLQTVSDLAFNGCMRLDEFDAPSSLKEIGTDAFNNCEQLILITENSPIAEEYAQEYHIPTGFASSDGYVAMKLIIGIVLVLAALMTVGYFMKKRRKKVQ